MIDIERAKQELIKFVNNQEVDQVRATNKLDHIMRVAQISEKLAINLKLTEEQIKLAELIGILHDIGRFKQYQLLNQKTSKNVLEPIKKYNHGEAGVKILKEQNYIRKYIQKDSYDDIIYTAIEEHNRYKLTEGLTKEKELFCKIIKDADKIDLIYEAIAIYWQEPKEIQQIENGQLSKKMLEDFYAYKLADYRNGNSKTDQILRFASFVFDLNFSYSFQILKSNNHITKMIDRFAYQLPETKEEMVNVKKIANEYIEKKIEK